MTTSNKCLDQRISTSKDLLATAMFEHDQAENVIRCLELANEELRSKFTTLTKHGEIQRLERTYYSMDLEIGNMRSKREAAKDRSVKLIQRLKTMAKGTKEELRRGPSAEDHVNSQLPAATSTKILSATRAF
jgi:hypothetical protein